MDRKVRFDSRNLNTGNVPADNCNCISFYNPTGNVGTFYINNVPVPPGAIYTLACLAGEIDTTVYNARFTSTSEKYFVTRKYYI